MTKKDLFRTLCSSYALSGIPVVLVNGDEIQKNPLFTKTFSDISTQEINYFIDNLSEKQGLCHEMLNGKFYTANVINIDDITVIEITHIEAVRSLVDIPAVREYLVYVFSKLRFSVSNISIAADEIYSALSANSSDNVSANLNRIDSSLLDIISLIIDPEQIVYLIGETDNDSIVSLKDEISKYADDLKTVFCGHSEIKIQNNDIMFSRLNPNTFRTVFIDAVSQFKNDGIIPDTITISSCQISDDTAKVSIESDCSGGRSCSALCIDDNDNDSVLDNFFFDFICDAFCKRYNGTFEKLKTDCGIKFTFTFPTIRNIPLTVSAPFKFDFGLNRFDVASIRMRDFNSAKKYKLK